MMQLVGAHLYRYNAPFVLEFKSTHLSRFTAESILVELIFDNGISGWGESAPRPYVTGETQETVSGLVRDVFAGALLGAEIETLANVRTVLDRLEETCRMKGISAFNSALGAVDLALLDALAKKEQLSFPELLRPLVREEIPYAFSVPLLSLPEVERLLDITGELNMNALKIVMNQDPDGNYERVRLVRHRRGDADIRIDANGNWTVQQALENIGRLKEFGLSAVEQPTAARDTEGLRTIRMETGIPVIADESMCSLADARRLVEAEACDILNIKISKCGGLLRSLDIADYAASKALSCQLGSHIGETAVLNRAGAYFALAIPNLTLYEGCSPLLFGSDQLITAETVQKPLVAGSGEKGTGLRIDRTGLEPVLSIP